MINHAGCRSVIGEKSTISFFTQKAVVLTTFNRRFAKVDK
jgi:hypothetical protein